MTSCLFICALSMLLYRGSAQDIVYPKEEVIAHLSGNNPIITERIPIYIPMRCPENMLLYPGSGTTSSWICDCKPGYLYFPLNNTCHEAYRRGPCPLGNYVHLPINEAIPQCVENPCSDDGLVPYNGNCHELRATQGPCNDGILGVNGTTFQIECITAPVLPPQNAVRVSTEKCPTGSRKDSSGLCRVLH